MAISVSLIAKGQLLPGNVYYTDWCDEGKSDPLIGVQQLTGTGRNLLAWPKHKTEMGLRLV
jgi:hypothetical protein